MESQNELSQLQELTKGTTTLRTHFNGINALSSVGILSIPYALSQGGWLSLVLFFMVAVLCWYIGLLLQRCMDSNPLIKTYLDIGEAAFGHKGRVAISVFMYLELYLFAIEFLILEGDNLDKLFPNTSFKLAGLKVKGQREFMMLTTLVILPTTWLRSLRMMAYISAGGVLASIVVVACVFWAGAFDGVGFHEGDKLLNLGGLPTTIGLFVFCYCGHVVFPTLCNSMKDQSQFLKLWINGHFRILDAVIITHIVAAIEDKAPFTKSLPISILLRTLVVFSTVIVALIIPFFGYVMAFIGAFLSVTVSTLLPCLFYLKINETARRFGFELMIIVGILVVGLFVGVVGTYTSLQHIVNHL
ncbi:hypothetical protein UlMin_041095 [Ulmus minor]